MGGLCVCVGGGGGGVGLGEIWIYKFHILELMNKEHHC